ncbi:superoxide dismutase [Streptomyces tateyamensis]|uniref:Superoxide dismutase n=1 Tax=Streptomyces tateyamensis TaxID=565073 RepID=A0A2V4MZP0_9ACTN|nr:superoxide dismutase family protein [Streptomyces tateyamensis]PYC77046.1 superoxide dismutase [Streptomyces tateyamensis]
MRAPLLAASSFTAALSLVALGAPGAGAAGPATVVTGRFAPAGAGAAVTFAPDLVPFGAQVQLVAGQLGGRTEVRLTVQGLAPWHSFPVHAHTGACGAAPTDSGPHYQDQVDPVQPSTDPAYANDRNELHLLLSTDGTGHAEARAELDWTFRPGEARSVVLHAGADAGGHPASERVACVDVPF